MSLERAAFLRAMRGVASSVAVVTSDGPTGRHGATVTSFCSVSADPPSLLVCLRAASRIAQAVTANRVFCVNILREGADALADRFAGRCEAADRFAGVELIAGGPPVLAQAAAAFRCRLTDTMLEGSHVIAVGRVVEVHAVAEPPLAYHDGRYVALTRPLPAFAAASDPCRSRA